MDLTRQVGYRGFALNTLVKADTRLYGCEIQRVTWQGVAGFGYTEKRALADGYDASDVFLGKRGLTMRGAVYGRTRGEAWDYLQALLTALTPTASYAESPGDRGYLPLDFYVPTADLVTWPDGYVHRKIEVRPIAQPTYTVVSDQHGGSDPEGLSIEWEVSVEAIDPRVYYFSETVTDIPVATLVSAGNFVNRGDYPVPLNLLLYVPAACGAGTFNFITGGADITIEIEDKSGDYLYQYSSKEKVLVVSTPTGPDVLRMDLLTTNAQNDHPLLAPGQNAYNWTRTGTGNLNAASRFWHTDAWA